jgi:hypothetical protein
MQKKMFIEGQTVGRLETKVSIRRKEEESNFYQHKNLLKEK